MRTEVIRVRISENLKNKIKERAKSEGRTISNFLEFTIKEYIENKEKKTGIGVSELKNASITLNISPEFKEIISAEARNENRSISNYISMILQSSFSENLN